MCILLLVLLFYPKSVLNFFKQDHCNSGTLGISSSNAYKKILWQGFKRKSPSSEKSSEICVLWAGRISIFQDFWKALYEVKFWNYIELHPNFFFEKYCSEAQIKNEQKVGEATDYFLWNPLLSIAKRKMVKLHASPLWGALILIMSLCSFRLQMQLGAAAFSAQTASACRPAIYQYTSTKAS